MKKIFNLITVIMLSSYGAIAQPVIYPAAENKGVIFITNATIHVGNGTVIENGGIIINKDKIEKAGTGLQAPAGAQVIDAKGKKVYPGLISSNTNLGLKEISGGVRGTSDYMEFGDINTSIRSVVAYNTDSRVINVLRTNGILLANVVPQDEEGGSNQLISGTSSVVQLDAWNYEDAAYKMDGQMHLNIPSFVSRRRFGAAASGDNDPAKQALEKIETLKTFFKNAQAYLAEGTHSEINLNYEAMKNLFDKKQKLFVHCNSVKEMLMAIDLKNDTGFEVVIVGGADSWQITDLLKQNNIAVILNQMHSLPAAYDDDVDQPFKTPAMLQKAGILFAISDVDNQTRGRNLMFNAGTAAAYGLTKEQALSAITLNAAKILGIDQRTGSIEAGKDANIIIVQGDVLEMQNSIVDMAFIQGRKINLDNKHSQLAERYKYKYGVK